MQVSNNITPKYNNYNKYKNGITSQQTFTGINISKGYDKFCEGVGKTLRPLYNNIAFDKMGNTIKNSDNAVKHFLAVGSVITSGMYMHQTYTNKKMDKDRRTTLTANQGFTLVLSTLGAYTLDNSLKNWWKKQHIAFLKLTPNGQSILDGMNEMNSEISKKNIQINKTNTEKILNGEIVSDLNINDDKTLNKLIKKFVNSDYKFDKGAKLGIFAQKLADAGIKTDNPEDVKGLIKKCKEIVTSGGELKNKIINAVKAEDYVRKLIEPKIDINDFIDKFGEKHIADKDALKKLSKRSKGFAALRSILVFGFVYRFFVPLTVVKPTNWICEKYLEHKKAKQAQLQINKAA